MLMINFYYLSNYEGKSRLSFAFKKRKIWTVKIFIKSHPFCYKIDQWEVNIDIKLIMG